MRNLRCVNALLLCSLVGLSTHAAVAQPGNLVRDAYGGIIRGDVSQKKLALIFTGDEYGDGTASILDTLKERKIAGGLFVTGKFVDNPKFRPLVKRAIDEGHYVGPHSDQHLLYASWDNRDKSLVTQREFTRDLMANIGKLHKVGALSGKGTMLFIPPYEHFNRDQVKWSQPLGVTLFNFTPGSGSNRDYIPESDPHFPSSQKIYDDILAYEQKDPHGLNGFILLTHLGSQRKDGFHTRLGALCDELTKRGYQFVRVDRLLAK